MNSIQFSLFFIYFFSMVLLGLWIYGWLGLSIHKEQKLLILGEICLLGGILCAGEFLILSCFGLYQGIFLWAVVLAHYLLLFYRPLRKSLSEFFSGKTNIDLPKIFLFILLIIFFFRNCYFLVDVDSHSVYLFSQKLWLTKGTSIFADPGIDSRIYVPHFDAIFYSLGISLFGQETLFCQLVNWFWRFLSVLLVYGYTSQRFNSTFGLASSMFLIFNDHFFISGANQWVVINGALIALLFASAYNFWEARRQDSLAHLVLGLIFLTQLMANKYQMAYVTLLLFIVGISIQQHPLGKLKEIVSTKKYRAALVVALGSMGLWYIKNYLATGILTYPIFAGKFYAIGWTPEKEMAFREVFRGISFNEFFKYLSYLFIWPGIMAAKFVGLTFSFLPVIFFISRMRGKDLEGETFLELCYWLGISLIIIMGICLASHQDPRYYRYPLAVFSFTAIYAINYGLRNCFNLNNNFFIGIIIILLAMPGFTIMRNINDSFRRPSIQDNMNVILNKLHMEDVISKHYPQNKIVLKEVLERPQLLDEAAWYMNSSSPQRFSAFLLPGRPQVDFWNTTIIGWDSFVSEEKIVHDLTFYGIRKILDVGEGRAVSLSPEQFAKEAVQFERYPKTIFYPYQMPEELTRTKF